VRTSTMSPPIPLIEGRPRSTDLGPEAEIDGPGELDHTLKARYDVWIQTLKNHPIGIEEGIYVSTFQKGRGQHITALSTHQARVLGQRLITLADEIETEVTSASKLQRTQGE